MNDAYKKICEESERRAKVSGCSTIIHWLQNDVDIEGEMPKPHYRPIKYIKTALLWAFYYLKHEYQFNDAIKDIVSKGGDTTSNAMIVGGLIGAARGMQAIN
jgi:ADP-ribosyl-[dinitrogen reductase] hydrolase